jgi:hypothetical protein
MRSSRIYEELLRPRFVRQGQADKTKRDLNNSSYPARTEFNNCFDYLFVNISDSRRRHAAEFSYFIL